MVDWLLKDVFGKMWDIFVLTIAFLFTNITAIAGFVLALLILGRMFSEKRNPSNFFAWSFIIIFIPFLGVPLYLLFGGRKSRRLARWKREVQEIAERISVEEAEEADAEASGQRPLVSAPYALRNLIAGGNHPYDGNHFELLPDGCVTFRRLMEEIDRAERRICVATFIFHHDAAGGALVDRLVARAREGLDVRVLVDALGSWGRTRRIQRRLTEAGARFARFMPVLPLTTRSSANLRNHRKLAIFDDCRVITGGQNLDLRFIGLSPDSSRFVDFSAVISGPAAKAFNYIFVSDWAFAAKTSPRDDVDILHYDPERVGGSTVEIISSGPDVEGDPLWEQIIRMVQECRSELTIVTPYFIPDEILFQSLIVKAHTGRRIRIVLPFQSNHKIADIARYHYLRKLNDAGVEILFYKPGMLHAKLIMVDKRIAMIGSANIDMRSLFVNFEVGVLHYTDSDITTLGAWTDGVIADSVGFDQSPRATSRRRTKTVEDLVHLVAPLL